MAVCVLTEMGHAQYEEHAQRDKGPRALGLLELSPGGKAHLIPIAIMYNGDFFDAGAYKANPVPMALDSGTVYEAEHSGVSQGLFTVIGALENNGSFIGQGKWQDAASVAAAAAAAKKKQIPSVPRGIEDTSGPPKLHRRNTGQNAPQSGPSSQTPSPNPSSSAPSSTSPAGSTPNTSSAPNAGGAPSSPPSSSGDDRPVLKKPPSESGQASQPAAQTSAPQKDSSTLPGEASDESDPNRPKLRREKPAHPPTASTPEEQEAVVKKAASIESPSSAKLANVQLVPAISDAGGPPPESYVYPMKPEDEQQFRKKMLALAAENVSDYVKKWSGAASSGTQTKGSSAHSRTTSAKSAARSPQPDFNNVQMQVFDLSASNEPTLVLTATAQMPHRGARQEKEELGPQYFVTLVASQDIYGDLHKILANITDQNHLDVAPRMEIIDAVDADGDRRGELLFRETSDRGSGFAIYRVIGYQLFELFQNTPGEQ